MLSRKPIYIDLDRRREIVFNLNTEILIREEGKGASSLWESIGVETDPETGEEKKLLDVNLENLRVYLWAALFEDAKKHGEILTHRKYVTEAVLRITEALRLYYGDDEGEA